jgi:hypothetical protein
MVQNGLNVASNGLKLGVSGSKRFESGLNGLKVGLSGSKRLESGLKWLKSGSNWFKTA